MHSHPQPFSPLLRQIFQAHAQMPTVPALSKYVSPRVDIAEEDARFVIFVDIPGIEPADVEIEVDKNTLVLRGERKGHATAEGVQVTRSERWSGRFTRQFDLPETVDQENISAQGALGVLEITLPKRPETSPRKIAVS